MRKNLQNSIFYKLYLYYNLFYRHKAFKTRESYSQDKEDLFINEYFRDIKNGFYIDIGAYHPIRYSNTALLYNRGWQGVNIDMNQTSIDLFNIARKRDINICAAVSSSSKFVTQFIDHRFSPVNTIDEKFSKSISKKLLLKRFSEKKVQTQTFEKLIKDNKLEIKKIEFLNIDVESHDFEVLQGINLTSLEPKLICIELENSQLNSNDQKIENYLEKYDYYLIKKTGLNGIFKKN